MGVLWKGVFWCVVSGVEDILRWTVSGLWDGCRGHQIGEGGTGNILSLVSRSYAGGSSEDVCIR